MNACILPRSGILLKEEGEELLPNVSSGHVSASQAGINGDATYRWLLC